MKKYSINFFNQQGAIRPLLVILFIINNNIFAQQQYNLAPNYSFEDYVICPSNLGIAGPPPPWYYPSNMNPAIYMNSCSNDSLWTVPTNSWSNTTYQYPHTGNAYVGLFFRNLETINERNYVQEKLKDSMIAGRYYYADFYVSLTDAMGGGCNNISMAISKKAIWVDTLQDPFGVIPFNAQIVNYGNPVITDTMNWVKVSAVYKAQGGEKYVTIGNFKYDSATLYDTIAGNSNNYAAAAYYVDDVSVIPLDSMPLKADAGRDTTITTGDSAFIGTYTNGIDSIKWQILNSNNTIDSIRPGLWVHPTVNTCYVVTQIVNGFTSSDTVCVTVQPLPLKFISFSITTPTPPKEGNVKLDWVTANEINVSHFYVQRSTNGKDFNIIGEVKAENKALNNYSFIDETTNEGVNYYRIVSVDIDGKTSFSDIKTINYKPQTTNGLRIFPNPSTDFVTVECKDAKEVSIIDCLGRVVYLSTVDRQQSTIINIKNFNNGLYVVQVITTKGDIKSEKFVIE